MKFKIKVNRNVRIFLFSDVLYWTASTVISTFLSVLVVEKIAPGRLDAVGLVTAVYLFCRAVAELPAIALQILLGVFDAIINPIKWTNFSRLLDQSNEEFEWGLEDFIPSVTGAVAALAGGVMSERVGISQVFVGFAIFYAVSGLSYLFIKVKRGHTR
ncbi:MAG: hypothetical protein UU16_C0059G0002 [Candidatus Woesebacteria bacterium GW2011_GWA2_40_7]|uniref:Major facilitator superfamily (MFS) profile domain-containing protein n=1 Tax=Candidatus Woesebacteria bacterium GW2011_GWA2_40_7 TaxID=1618562 RepID=A0A0G0T9S4_9BACT|nr:MAG: hypothetical protein UU16_C0059G0002 [Candidatus Woesebacteria bacterium GW2011_GWA2_40_7]